MACAANSSHPDVFGIARGEINDPAVAPQTGPAVIGGARCAEDLTLVGDVAGAAAEQLQ